MNQLDSKRLVKFVKTILKESFEQGLTSDLIASTEIVASNEKYTKIAVYLTHPVGMDGDDIDKINLTVSNDVVAQHGDDLTEFAKHFFDVSAAANRDDGNDGGDNDGGGDDIDLTEIIDEFGQLIGDEDMPNNATNSMSGKSRFGSDKAVQQTLAKIKTYDGNIGRGIVTW